MTDVKLSVPPNYRVVLFMVVMNQARSEYEHCLRQNWKLAWCSVESRNASCERFTFGTLSDNPRKQEVRDCYLTLQPQEAQEQSAPQLQLLFPHPPGNEVLVKESVVL